MEKRRNPYAPGAGTRPPVLVGRDDECEEFEAVLARLQEGIAGQSMLITGLRGVGKTVLLGELERVAHGQGWATSLQEVSDDTSLADGLARSVRVLLEELNPTGKLRTGALRVLSHLNAFSLREPNGYELSLTLTGGEAERRSLGSDFEEILVQLGMVAQERDSGIVLLIDELQEAMPCELSALITGLHRVTQKALPVTCVGAGLPHLPRLIGEAKSYAERMFTFPELDRLDRSASEQALVQPALSRDVRYTNEALDHIWDLTAGYPYFVQHYGKHIWDAAERSPITKLDVDRAADEAQASLDAGFYRVRMRRATSRERKYMYAMAMLGDGPYSTSSVAEQLGMVVSHTSSIRESLLKKGLVYSPDVGELDFTVPRFDDYLRRGEAWL